MTGTRRVRLLFLALAAAAAASALFLALRPAAGRSALGPRIYAFAVPANPGPVHACYDYSAPCPLNSTEQIPIYTTNTYPLANWVNQPADANARWAVPNAFDVSSIDLKITVNGVDWGGNTTLTPPPNAFVPGWAGHWPSTVRCDFTNLSACHVVGSPAVLPGENVAPLYYSWAHGFDEPDGVYVFSFTIHGTVNGVPTDITANTPPIVMTR